MAGCQTAVFKATAADEGLQRCQDVEFLLDSRLAAQKTRPPCP